MPHPSALELAKTAYAAYGEATGGLTHDDRTMPAWDDLGDRVRGAWTAAAGTIALEALAAVGSGPGVLTPDVGDVVLVPMDPAVNNGAKVAPAVITRVSSSTTVNVRVLADGEDTAWRTSLVYTDSFDGINGPFAVWTWPGGDN